MVEGRIWFPGNPWPDGHRVAKFRWTGWLLPEDGAGFDFSLKTAAYDEDDRARLDGDDYAFHVYLLGHDSVADHRIRFPVRHGPSRFDVEWTGRVALTYVGDDEFRYEFRAQVSAADFTGFALPRDLDDDDARTLLARCVRDADAFRLDDRGSHRRFVPAT